MTACLSCPLDGTDGCFFGARRHAVPLLAARAAGRSHPRAFFLHARRTDFFTARPSGETSGGFLAAARAKEMLTQLTQVNSSSCYRWQCPVVPSRFEDSMVSQEEATQLCDEDPLQMVLIKKEGI